MSDTSDLCAARIGHLHCSLTNGHTGLHCKPGQVPETTVWWKVSPTLSQREINSLVDERDVLRAENETLKAELSNLKRMKPDYYDCGDK